MILPPDLIRVKRTKEALNPQFAQDDKLGLAKTLIATYKANVDKRHSDLLEALSNCEDLGYDFKLVRGLTFILDGFCFFSIRSVLPPLKARTLLFEEATKTPVYLESDKNAVLSRVALILNASSEDVDESMYADLEDEQQLIEFNEPDPLQLLQSYNFALLVAVLSYSTILTIQYSGKNPEIEKTTASLGETSERGISTTSIAVNLKPVKHMTIRGAKFEHLLTRLIAEKDWSLHSDAAYPTRYEDTRVLTITRKNHGNLLRAEQFKDEDIFEIKPRPTKVSRYGEVVVLEDIARQIGITDRELIKLIDAEGVKYTKLGGVLYSPARLNDLKEELKGVEKGSLSEVKGTLRKYGVKNPIAILESLGYVVEQGDGKDLRFYKLRRRTSSI